MMAPRTDNNGMILPNVPKSKDQDEGIAHCHYIRQLAHEIYCKEYDETTDRKMKWEECIRQALLLHRKKLIRNCTPRNIPNTPTCW